MNTQEFKTRATKTHNGKFDYSKSEYTHWKDKILIICPEHGEFWQNPFQHLRGAGCRRCRNSRKKDQAYFLKRAQEKHGDKYDYSKTVYDGSRSRVIIICPEHGEFEQLACSHMNGSGCCRCVGRGGGRERVEERWKSIVEYCLKNPNAKLKQIAKHFDMSTGRVGQILIDHKHLLPQIDKTKDFIDKSKAVFGDRYDYSKTEYVNSRAPVTIVCPKHGEFQQRYDNHLSGKEGCKECSKAFLIKRTHEKHQQILEEYRENNLTTRQIAAKHHLHRHTVHQILKENGCTELARMTTETFIERAQEAHGDRYDYSKTVYSDARIHAVIICPKHGEFKKKPPRHLKGAGCPQCAMEARSERVRREKHIPLIADYKNGISIKEIESKYDMTRTHVYRILIDSGAKDPFKPITEEEFLAKAKEIHGDKYDYSKMRFIDTTKKVTVICPKHGEFKVTPSNHTLTDKANDRLGRGCPDCGRESQVEKAMISTKEFKKRARKIHGDLYDYSKVECDGWDTPIKIKCRHCGIWFEQRMGVHLTGCGCSACNKILLKDGTVCDSKVEAYHYLKFKQEGKNFVFQKSYGKNFGKFGTKTCDFYFPDEELYLEVTSFTEKKYGVHPRFGKDFYKKYRANIERKRKYVENVLKKNFKFVTKQLSLDEINLVDSNMKHLPGVKNV